MDMFTTLRPRSILTRTDVVKLTDAEVQIFDKLNFAHIYVAGTEHRIPRDFNQTEFDGVMPFSLVNFYVWPSVAWALLNLVPVLPLDGGRIAKSIIEMNGGSFATALWVSVISATLLALWGFKSDQMFIGIFFASFRS